jgi:hypothetical protein
MHNKKTESLTEYLARGGKINKLPHVDKKKQEDVARKPISGVALIMTLDDAALFYSDSEPPKKKKEKKTTSKLDLSALPAALREKFLKKIRDEGVDYDEED